MRKMNLLSSIATMMFAGAGMRNYAPDHSGISKGPRPNKYSPCVYKAGSTANAAQMNVIAAKYGRSTIVKKEPDPQSITNIKIKYHVTRHQARLIKEKMIEITK